MPDEYHGRYYIEINGASFLGEGRGILAKTKIDITKEMFYHPSSELHILKFTNKYFLENKLDTEKVTFKPVYIEETTTRKIILGNYTKYGGPPTDKDWD